MSITEGLGFAMQGVPILGGRNGAREDAAHVALVHLDLMSKGGGEAVAMNVIEALQEDHHLSLITARDPDWDALNAYFGTDVEPLPVEIAGWLAPALYDVFGLRYYVLVNALLARYARKRANAFDLLVSTINELALAPDSIEYVHFPFDWTVNLDNRDDIFHPTIQKDSLYERVASALANVTSERIQESTVLANSSWTADAVEEAYGARPRILHPPVDTRGFNPRPWSEREEGFVTIGRIEESKRIVELIRILDGVREHGHAAHLHIVGPTVDHAYHRTVETMAKARGHVHLEGETSHERIRALVSRHKYGIHGKHCEHFGMAVAEIAAGGAIPFVPSNGGQRAIVPDEKHLVYADTKDAVDKIVRIIEDPPMQDEIRQRLGPASIQKRFGRDRFQRAIKQLVNEHLDDPQASQSKGAKAQQAPE